MLSATVLLSRAARKDVFWPLGFCFLVLSMTILNRFVGTVAFDSLPSLIRHGVQAVSYPLDMLYLPLFWFYVRALTSERRQALQKSDVFHFIPALVALLIFCALLMISETERTALFDLGRDKTSKFQTLLFVLILSQYLAWLCQWFVYTFFILKRLTAYRKRLKDLFATTVNLELGWIAWLGFLILFNWLWVVSIFVLDVFTDLTPFEEPWLSLLDLLCIWVLSVWGMRQAPGLLIEVEATKKVERTLPRYEKSALNPAQLERLKSKLEQAMQQDHLYKDPDLSLSTLAKHIGARPNYVSQTLNACLGATFFDYVNQQRVKHAKAQLLVRSDTVLDIALEAGFNTRSSFYAAFKRYVGATPTAWRNASQDKINLKK